MHTQNAGQRARSSNYSYYTAPRGRVKTVRGQLGLWRESGGRVPPSLTPVPKSQALGKFRPQWFLSLAYTNPLAFNDLQYSSLRRKLQH